MFFFFAVDEEHKSGSFVVINDDIEVAYQHLRGIIMEEIAKAKNFKYKSKGLTVDGSGEGMVNGKWRIYIDQSV